MAKEQRKDHGFASGIVIGVGWPDDRWSVSYVPEKYPRPQEILFHDWTDEDCDRVAKLIAEIECAKHGHIICPAADSGCCDGRKCYCCSVPFSFNEHQQLMREQNQRECHCREAST